MRQWNGPGSRRGAAGLFDTRGAAEYWDRLVAQPHADSRCWLESSQANQRANRLTTGRPHVYPLSAFAEEFHGSLPVARALSVGCGAGSLEREVIRANIATHIDGIDISSASLDRARALADADPALAARTSYRLEDAVSWLPAQGPGSYQLIFFHGSLHHIAALEEVTAACAAVLREGPPGLLFVDEYVGPSRDQWCDADLSDARDFFARLDPRHLRTPVLMQPMDPRDPSEMVRSADIEPVLRGHFEVLRYRPYYGNVIYPLLSAIKGSSFSDPEVEEVLRSAIAREDALIDGGNLRPLFAVFVCRPRSAAEARRRTEIPVRDRLQPCHELESALRRLVGDLSSDNRALHSEIKRLNALVGTMESTRAWSVHRWAEDHVRSRWRRLRRYLLP